MSCNIILRIMSNLSCYRYTGSWDTNIGTWDPRQYASASKIITSGKVYSLSLSDTRLVVATADRHIDIFDIRNTNTPLEKRESPLKHQTREVVCLRSGLGFILGSIEVCALKFIVFMLFLLIFCFAVVCHVCCNA